VDHGQAIGFAWEACNMGARHAAPLDAMGVM
jgi:hypothetical protein